MRVPHTPDMTPSVPSMRRPITPFLAAQIGVLVHRPAIEIEAEYLSPEVVAERSQQGASADTTDAGLYSAV